MSAPPASPRRALASGPALGILLGLAALALYAVTLERTPIPWFDETFLASGSQRLAEGGDATPGVLGETFEPFPLDLFYGPVFVHLGALSFDALGFSIGSFRLLSLLGTVLLCLAGAWIVRGAGESRALAAWSFALLALTPELGSRATSGRMDPLVVGLEMAGLTLMILALDRVAARRPAWGLAAAAGAVWALALLSTPRSFPFFAGLALAAAALPRSPAGTRGRAFLHLCAAGAATVLLGLLGLALAGFTPLEWLGHIAATSENEPINVSPLMGGTWSFQLSPLTALTPLALAGILLVALGGLAVVARARRAEAAPGPALGFALAAVGGNALVTLLLLARPQSYGIFWVLPALPVVLAASARIARQGRTLRMAVLAAWCLLAVACLGLRAVKYADVLASWEARDPERLERFVAAHVAPGSRVFGPTQYYFYAVEAAGSEYRYAVDWGLVRTMPRKVRREILITPLPRTPGGQDFVLWPEGEALPQGLGCLRPAARWAPPPARALPLSRAHAFAGGYPPTVLYRRPAGCGD